MTLPEAIRIVGSKLGSPSKMPVGCRSWGISAKECDVGGELKLIEGTVCAICYADHGHYTCPSVVNAHARRIASIDDPLWVEAMAYMINVLGVDWFRWFDAGDIQSVEHLEKIVNVCLRTRTCNHWLPTHEVGRVGEFLEEWELPSNLCVRISADYVEDRPHETWGLPTSTVHLHKGEPVPSASGNRKESIECTAYKRDNHCGQCRACWEPAVLNVSYLKHW
jgi:hypothetical protein